MKPESRARARQGSVRSVFLEVGYDRPFGYNSAVKRLVWNRHTKVVLKHIAGWLCIVLGLIMCFTPGQGLLTILLGIYLLADTVPFFHRLKVRLEKRFPKTSEFVHSKKERLKAKFHKQRETEQ